MCHIAMDIISWVVQKLLKTFSKGLYGTAATAYNMLKKPMYN